MSTEPNELNDDHPLVLELSSLRQTAARFQHEAHWAALKLQHHTLVATQTNVQLHALESQHSLLTSELAALRAHPFPLPQTQSHTYVVQELTLALRRSSEKLDQTEHALADKTAELVAARSEALKARHEADAAHKLSKSARAREKEGKVRERALEACVRASQEERRLLEVVVHEYADLVRSLEGRKSFVANASALLQNEAASISPLTFVKGLHDGKASLNRLLGDFASENEKHESTIAQLRDEIANLQNVLDAERKTAAQNSTHLVKVQLELATLKLDDNTAAKMVSRYMKFSQSQTNALQATLTTLQARYASTQHTLQSTLSDTEAHLHSQMSENIRLRDALEELGEEVTREAYGRRREVAMRLALLAREEALGEALRRWVRRGKETIHRCTDTDSQIYATFGRAVRDVESFLLTLDTELALDDGKKFPSVLGSLVLAKDAVMRMCEEVAVEMRRRVAAEQRLSLGMEVHDDAVKGQTVVDVTGLPAHIQDAEPRMEPTGSNTDIPDTQDTIPTSVDPIPQSSLPAEGHKDAECTPSPVLREISPGNTRLLLMDELSAGPSQSPAVSILDLTQTPAVEVASIPPLHAGLSRTPLASRNDLPTTPAVINDTDENPDITYAQSSLPQLETPESPADQTLERDEDSGVFFTLSAVALEVAAVSPAVKPTNLTHDNVSEVLVLPFNRDEISALLSSLSEVSHRYDALQRAFRDCSLALKDLKHMLPTIASQTPSSSPHSLRSALERISDYTEDARVELEIRITDEVLAIRGFETLLTVPGALSSHSDLEEVRAFVDGTDEGVRKALERLEAKLDDVQHDVAVIKRAAHDLQLNEEEAEKEPEDQSWSAWTAGLLPRPSTPSPSQAPTFGSVMTSPQLRHQSSIKQLPSVAGLELRIPMPLPASPPAHGALGVGSAPVRRPRTMSMMYSLGIGPRASSLALPRMSPVKSGGAKGRVATLLSGTGLDHDRNESDVE